MELLLADKVPYLSIESQTGGAVTTRRMKKDLDSEKKDLNPVKKEEPQAVKRKLDDEDDVDMSHLMDDGLDDFLVERANRLELSENPLFKANLTFLPYKRQGLKWAVKKEQFSVTSDQLRKATEDGTVNSGYLSHIKYGIPVKEFVKRRDYVHAMFESLARKMNSA